MKVPNNGMTTGLFAFLVVLAVGAGAAAEVQWFGMVVFNTLLIIIMLADKVIATILRVILQIAHAQQ